MISNDYFERLAERWDRIRSSLFSEKVWSEATSTNIQFAIFNFQFRLVRVRILRDGNWPGRLLHKLNQGKVTLNFGTPEPLF